MESHRCAIYTRKSSEDGLEQDFNSLDAQKEACEAYIASQKHAGWELSDVYSDGGFSGGNMIRPGLQKLLEQIEAGKIGIVVVYKIDRLTRSLADFARLIEQFDRKGVSFVSVTQQFNTTSSMGRLTMNVLLSFAQFEREVTSERIRDKIAASKKKGMWMGGAVPFGYEIKDRQLIINKKEARVVRFMFERYLELKNVHNLEAELNAKGLRPKRRLRPGSTIEGPDKFSHGGIRALLMNRLYLGIVVHKDQCYPGMHKAIIDEKLWNAVQKVLARKSMNTRQREMTKKGIAFAGIIFDENGKRLNVCTSKINNKTYVYYRKKLSSSCIEVHEIEQLVRRSLLDFLGADKELAGKLPFSDPSTMKQIKIAAQKWIHMLGTTNTGDLCLSLRKILQKIIVGPHSCSMVIRQEALDDIPGPRTVTISVPCRLSSPCVERRFIPCKPNMLDHVENHVILKRAIVRAHSWWEQMLDDDNMSLHKIAEANGVTVGYINDHLELAFLDPDLVKSIIGSKAGPDLSLQGMAGKLSVDWADQRRQFL